jgi:hypothetical protein
VTTGVSGVRPDTAAARLHPSSANGAAVSPESLEPLLCRVRDEFVAMPGLSLTEPQAARLWQLDPPLTAVLLRALVEARFLARTGAGLYRRLSAV